MKKQMIAGLLTGVMLTLAACGSGEVQPTEYTAPFSVKTVSPPEGIGMSAARLGAAEQPCAVILTAPFEAGYELNGSLDYDGFIAYLAGYYGTLYEDGGELLVSISDMIDYGEPDGGRGVVTVLATYHTRSALETGRNSGNTCGGCNFFFSYDAKTGADFETELFAGTELLHSRFVPQGSDSSEYTLGVNNRGEVQIYRENAPIIATPARYCCSASSLSNDAVLYVDGDHIVLLILAHDGEPVVNQRKVYVYSSHDGGGSWDTAELDYTPTTTTLKHPPCSLVLNMRDAQNGTAILGTARCEVFFYVTEDGGRTWEKRRNFKLLNYQNDALYAGGLVDDTLGFISFIPREGKNPNVYITYDGGKTWALMDIAPPAGYDESWMAYGETAYTEEERIVLPITVGDAQLRYVSDDHGRTWRWDNDTKN